MPALDARPGVVLAALVVTWVAVVLLVLMVAALHVRVARLERAGAARPAARPDDAPFAGLLGRTMTELTGGPAPRVLLVLTSSCRSCRSLLADLAEPEWTIPTALAWADGSPGTAVGPHVTVLPDGPRIGSALGVRVTPFGLVAGDDGRIAWAGPVTGLPALADRARTGAPTRS